MPVLDLKQHKIDRAFLFNYHVTDLPSKALHKRIFFAGGRFEPT